jgi:hypothetical protein
MGKEYLGEVYIVAATKDGKTDYWAAAVPQANALAAVRDMVAPGWQLSLTNRRLSQDQVRELEIEPRSVRQLKGES